MSVIEHRSTDGVLGAFMNSGMTKFAVWQGTVPILVYDEKDPDFEEENNQVATDKLTTCLNFIAEGGTSAIYMLKVYPDDTKSITNKTPFRAATRFQLAPSGNSEYHQTPDGKVMVIRSQTPALPASNTANAGLTSRLDSLEKTNRELQEKLHAQDMKFLEQSFEHKIAGLQKQEEEKPDVWTRIGESLVEKPENLDRALSHAKDIIGMFLNAFRPQKDFINKAPAPSPVNGTKQQPMHQEQHQDPEFQHEGETQVRLTSEGAYDHDFLTEEQKKLKRSAQYPIMKAAIEQLDTETMNNEQMICLQVLEERLGAAVVTHLLIVVASLDNEDLNKLLNNLA